MMPRTCWGGILLKGGARFTNGVILLYANWFVDWSQWPGIPPQWAAILPIGGAGGECVVLNANWCVNGTRLPGVLPRRGAFLPIGGAGGARIHTIRWYCSLTGLLTGLNGQESPPVGEEFSHEVVLYTNWFFDGFGWPSVTP
jgi:hypothetical protein